MSLYIGGLVATAIVSLLNWSREVSPTSFLVAHLLWPFSILWAVCLVERQAPD